MLVYILKLDGGRPSTRSWTRSCTLELSDLPHLPIYKLVLQGEEEKDYYLLTDLIARLNISRSTFSMNYPAFTTYKMKWKDFARLLGKSPFFVHPERLPSQICEFIEVSENANRILNIRSEVFETVDQDQGDRPDLRIKWGMAPPYGVKTNSLYISIISWR
eukprot:sb/3472796/